MNEPEGNATEGELIGKDAPLPQPRGGKRAVLRVDLAQQITNTTTVTVNVAQEVHVTTRDKIELALRKILPRYLESTIVLGPLGVFLALFVGLVTADFNAFMNIDKEVWEAIFILSSLLAAALTVRNAWRYKNRARLKDIVDAIVAQSKEL